VLPELIFRHPARARLLGGLALLFSILVVPTIARTNDVSFADVIAGVQPKIVKIYGAGGIRGLEAYQSGFLISPQGHILTVWSYVLDTDVVTVTLDDGRRYSATLLGADPRLEIALLKIEAEDLSWFDWQQAQVPATGARVLAFSNLFGVATGDEDSSVLHGNVAARTQLSARRGAFESTYQGPVLVLDAITNNPGAAGGALTDSQGRLIGLLGKELRSSLTNTWLNYAIPIQELASSIDDILAGRLTARREDSGARRPAQAMTLEQLGIVLIPDVLPKTPPFIDQVRSDSPAERGGLKPDDLVLFVNDRLISSIQGLRDELGYVDRIDDVRLTVQRAQELLEVRLRIDP
jgi:S1-C subfamily serine protease